MKENLVEGNSITENAISENSVKEKPVKEKSSTGNSGKQGKIKPNRNAFLLLFLIPLYFILIGLWLQPVSELGEGLLTIIREPDFLITDYFVLGGPGAALINAGVVTLLCLLMVFWLRMEIDGHTLTALCLMFGFSLFGKNLLNIWLILVGVFLYARVHKTPLSKYLYIGFYGTSLSPIITELMQLGHLPFWIRLFLAVITGLSIGFVLPPLSTYTHYAHNGYSLYNVGFAAGIIATVVMSLCKSFGMTVESRLLWSTEYTNTFTWILAILFLGMLLASLFPNPMETLRGYRAIWKAGGRGGTDYVKEAGVRPTIFNMAVNGLFCILFVRLVGGDLNGPSIGAIFTVVGFSSTGKHLRGIAPVMAGVWLASLTKQWNISDPSALLALLLSTTLAPISAKFGIIWGMIAGYLHSSVALNVGIVYGGMNLYNNGFAGGLVAIFLVPLIQSFQERRARAKEEISL